MYDFSCWIVVGIVGFFCSVSRTTSSARARNAGFFGSMREREVHVGGGVFVAAENLRVGGQIADLEQRIPHHLRAAFDDAAAPDREQRIADEGELVLLEPVADVAGGVARRLEHAADQRADLHDIALAYRHVDIGNLRCLLARRDDAAEVLLLQLRDAAGMIRVMVRHQDVGKAPTFFGERGFDRRGLGRIDCRRRAGRRVVQQNAVIVLQAEEKWVSAGMAGLLLLHGGVKLARLFVDAGILPIT